MVIWVWLRKTTRPKPVAIDWSDEEWESGVDLAAAIYDGPIDWVKIRESMGGGLSPTSLLGVSNAMLDRATSKIHRLVADGYEIRTAGDSNPELDPQREESWAKSEDSARSLQESVDQRRWRLSLRRPSRRIVIGLSAGLLFTVCVGLSSVEIIRASGSASPPSHKTSFLFILAVAVLLGVVFNLLNDHQPTVVVVQRPRGTFIFVCLFFLVFLVTTLLFVL